MKKMNIKQLITATAGALIIYGNSAMAGTVGTMNTFSSGTAAVAADVNANFTEHTTQINDNASTIATMQTMAVSDTVAAVDCSTQTIADVAGSQPAWGSLTLTITGTCDENLLIDNRSNVTLISTTGAIINGTDTTIPTIEIKGQQRIKLIGLTIRGGKVGVKATNNSEVLFKNVTINDNSSTGGPGLWVSKSSTATLIGNQDVTTGLGPSTGGNTITGGVDPEFGFGVVVVMHGTLHLLDGTTVINAGGNGMAAVLAGFSGLILHDNMDVYTPNATLTGNIEMNGSSMNLDGGTGTIVGNLNVSEGSDAITYGPITGNVTLWARSQMIAEGGSSISGTVTPELMSFFEDLTGTAISCTPAPGDTTSTCL